jgi:cyclohexanecarboxylate-CoA ligase
MSSEFDPVAHGKAMRARGFWRDRMFDDDLTDAIARTPDKLALAAYRADRDQPRRLTYRELGDLVGRCSAALRALGIGRGDVVAVQLPNWWEFVVITLATNRLGAIVNPLMPIFRERELSYMLSFAGAKLLVVPQLFRGFDHAEMARSLKSSLPSLHHIAVVDGNDEDSFERRLLGGSARLDAAPVGESALRPDDVAVLMFTSGTTGSPKGVMHSTNTVGACTDGMAARFGLNRDDVLFACSPVGHMTGYTASMMLSIRLGGTLIMQDIWEAKRGVAIMTAENVTYTGAATPFLKDICDVVAAGAPRPERLRSFMCGGAPIPPVLIERAARELDLKVCSLWGMTESLGSTLTEPARSGEKSSSTDGRATDGVEVRVVDREGQVVPAGTTGRLMVRGALNFIGYYNRPDLPRCDVDGWFDTGDLAFMDEEGYIRINGRIKDVLIRGGENVPVLEIESLLYKHPAVADVAIVGFPDERLGERACAFIVARAGETIDLAGVQAHMMTHKVAKQYWPERVRIIAQLPRTPSGKVQKFKLREEAVEG